MNKYRENVIRVVKSGNSVNKASIAYCSAIQNLGQVVLLCCPINLWIKLFNDDTLCLVSMI